MSSHRIALKGPWDYLWTSLTKDQQFQGSAKMPVEYTCLHGNEAGEVQYSRSFHYPRIQIQSPAQQDSPKYTSRQIRVCRVLWNARNGEC